ncbi:putative secreted lipase [Labilithrix luteola]|uniref:Putative secreted lipase n=1 Tax=Labilithrix luteola TaxID=1391654 RepID=A0A0K1QC73_9BACT|nr:alpha/beta fold hydrolase [Labilithrix luteola]AKV03252.1 putative secreted lipase [Labilithrix luteola]
MSHWERIVVELLEVVGALGLAFLFGIAIYVLGSFALTGSYTTRRAFGSSFRAVFREATLAVLTQPLLPLFYVLGYRMDRFLARRGREGLTQAGVPVVSHVPIVFVHGYMQNRVGFLGLARALAHRGFGPLYGFNYPWLASIASNAGRLDRFVDRVIRETGAAKVDIVCHSMGGLVATEMMRAAALKKDGTSAPLKVRRCVTIATPHAGIVWRGPIFGLGSASLRRGSKLLETQAGQMLAVPCLSIYSAHDNIVYPKETSSLVKRGGRDFEVEHHAHLAILFSPKVADAVATFLAEPDASPPKKGADPV